MCGRPRLSHVWAGLERTVCGCISNEPCVGGPRKSHAWTGLEQAVGGQASNELRVDRPSSIPKLSILRSNL